MSEVVAIISMLHESVANHSAIRQFRGQSVLAWTLRRLAKVQRISSAFILCWDDQSPRVAEVDRPACINIACKGRRRALDHLDAVAAAGRWMDGWRGGLLQTCDFDLGFHGAWIVELIGDADALLIDPNAALIDPELINALFERADEQADLDMFFSQAAPGLNGVLVRSSVLRQLAAANQHPGKLLHYLPERPSRDPISGEACIEVAAEIARTSHRFKLDSRRQIEQVEAATSDLNGTLIDVDAAELVRRLTVQKQGWATAPREITLELTTRRSTFPAFGPARHFPVNRPELSADLARILFRELAEIDDLRLTFGGVGDPLCHPAFFEIVEAARTAGIHAIHVETDLYEIDSAQVAGLAEAGIDIISVNLPAITAQTYQRLMGIDGYAQVIQNIRQLVLRRQG
ncbi:MAG TPA: radical SAM protein, partial [Tepidisphaeraceae bacterium]|nr:radical SAM protein [Tepidisphaeraceae bacterium]